MIATLVDSNVLLDVLGRDERWYDWSRAALAACGDQGPLAINPVVYGEVSIRFQTIEALDEALPSGYFQRLALPWDAAFLAGKAFLAYRRQGGPRGSVLPDFYIGAHAAVSRLPLLTRDTARYRTYFPTVHLISPAAS